MAKECADRWCANEKGEKNVLAAWDDMMLEFVTRVVRHIREGEPVIDLWNGKKV